uniref:Putative reverse transcriptase domain, viral movement protein n=1 Tax=Tanacetum cinerariifolium TaxID=118510 RepID=A0A6L2P7G2_TANCI|nr:putative reverse transcriptase domain, viral movement protein [Tanacetum cinerariifolium]
MDMSSFPRMLQFKRKMLPHAQVLRWSNWFSQWKFTVEHIKGTENVLADFLSSPKAYKLEENASLYHAPYCFIHDWYKVNPSSKKCERNLQTLYTDTRGLMARANGVDPNKIPYHVMWNISIWSKDHPDDNFDHCEVETSDDDDEARSLWSSDDKEHFDPFEDDPTHPDARWSL